MNNLRFKKIIIGAMFFGLLAGFFPLAVSAQESSNNNQGFKFTDYLNNLEGAAGKATYKTGNANDYFNNLISNIIAVVIGLTGSIFLILIIYSGWQWLTAGGEEEKISQAKNRIKNAVIGLGLCLLAFGITSFVNRFLENKFLKDPVQAPIEAPADSVLCTNDIQCADRPLTPKCSLSKGICVECVNDNGCTRLFGVKVDGKCTDNRCIYPGCSSKSSEDCKSDDKDDCNYVKEKDACVPIFNSGCGKCSTPDNICFNGECVRGCSTPSDCAWYQFTCSDGICKAL